MTVLQAATEVCTKAIRLNASLHMVGKTEIVYCSSTCNFFENRPELVKAREEVFKMIERTQNLRWVLPLSQFEHLSSMLPKEWNTVRWNNVCFCIALEIDNEKASALIESFQNISVSHRMLFVPPLTGPLDLDGKLRGINWVISDGGPFLPDHADAPPSEWSGALRDACKEAGAAFFFHRSWVPAELDGCMWQGHPFGRNVDLTSGPLPGTEKLLSPPPTCAAKPAVPVETSAKSKSKATATIVPSAPTDDQAQPPATSGQLKTDPCLATEPLPEDLETATHDPELPAATGKPKASRRGRKVKPKRSEEAIVSGSGFGEKTADPVPASIPVVDGNSESAPGDNTDAEDMEFEVLPMKKSLKQLGNAKTGENGLAAPDLADFKRLHGIVVRCAGLVFDAGNALAEIRSRKLWRAGGFASWNAYVAGVQGITKRHANHLIATAEVVGVMREVGKNSPTSSKITPQIPSQVSPLLRIKDECRRNEAWSTAVKRSGGQQPKPKIVAQVVAEILEDFDKPASPSPKQSRAAIRAEVFVRLKVAARARKDWDLIEKLVEELEDLLQKP